MTVLMFDELIRYFVIFYLERNMMKLETTNIIK